MESLTLKELIKKGLQADSAYFPGLEGSPLGDGSGIQI